MARRACLFTFPYNTCEAENVSVWHVGFKVLVCSRFATINVKQKEVQVGLQVLKYLSVHVLL